MSLRLPIAAFLVAVLPVPITHAQEVVSDVAIPGASMNDGYMGWTTCGVDGQVFRHSGTGHLNSIMRVSRDGSTVVFSVPDGVTHAISPNGQGLNILSSRVSDTDGRILEMSHFDNRANLLTQHRVALDFAPTDMAVTSSGKTIVVGHQGNLAKKENWMYAGAVLDVDDQVIQRFGLPTLQRHAGWAFNWHMSAGGNGAYVMLYSREGPETAIATISDAGQLDIKVVPVPPDTGDRHHNGWMFGPGVAVEWYRYSGVVGERKRAFFGFDEYDPKSGEKVATKSTRPVGIQPGCYLGNEYTALENSAHVDPTRGLAPDALRLVTVKLADGQTTK
jgi:hypothetical protein